MYNVTQPCKEDIRDTADRLVNVERQEYYDSPINNFTKIATMMTGAGFRCTGPNPGEIRVIEPRDIPIFMILTKISREVFRHKEDNLVDIVGYVKTLESIHKSN